MVDGFKAYPSESRQGRFYAIRFLRWLVESGSVNDIGPDGMALLVAVVTQEDHLHYQRPPVFWREQLLSRCGMRSVHSLIAARNRAVQAGLLVYQPGAKRRPSVYFTDGFSAESARKEDDTAVFCRDSVRNAHEKPSPSNRIPEPEQINSPTARASESVSGEKPKARTKRSSKANIGFDRWYETYPRKEARGNALKAYPKAIAAIQADSNVDESTAAEILLKLTLERLPMLESREWRFIPHPATWLNAQGFWDKPTASSSDDELPDFTNVPIEGRKHARH